MHIFLYGGIKDLPVVRTVTQIPHLLYSSHTMRNQAYKQSLTITAMTSYSTLESAIDQQLQSRTRRLLHMLCYIALSLLVTDSTSHTSSTYPVTCQTEANMRSRSGSSRATAALKAHCSRHPLFRPQRDARAFISSSFPTSWRPLSIISRTFSIAQPSAGLTDRRRERNEQI